MAIETLEIQDLKDEIFRREDFVRRNPQHRATGQYAREIPRLKMRLQKATGEDVPGAEDTTDQARARLFGENAAAPADMPAAHEGEDRAEVDPDDDGALSGGTEIADADD